MSQYIAEDFRRLVDTLSEYMSAVDEADDLSASKSSQSIDDLLTKPAGLQKLAGNLNVGELIQRLDIPQDLQGSFKSAIAALQSDKPQLDSKQTLALATAFDHMLASGDKGSLLNNIKAVSAAESTGEITEANDTKTKIASIKDLTTVIKDAGNTSPVSKLQATKLVYHIIKGMNNRTKNGGISHVMTGVVSALTAAKNGQEASALKSIASMVNHVEGDEQAISSREFSHIVVALMLLVGDVLQYKSAH